MRTDFTDDAAWASLVERVSRPGPGYDDPIDDFGHYFTFVDDPAFAGATPEQLMAQVRHHKGAVAADATAMREPGNRVLVIPLAEETGYAFRMDPEYVGIMAVNLSIANMGIDDWRNK